MRKVLWLLLLAGVAALAALWDLRSLRSAWLGADGADLAPSESPDDPVGDPWAGRLLLLEIGGGEGPGDSRRNEVPDPSSEEAGGPARPSSILGEEVWTESGPSEPSSESTEEGRPAPPAPDLPRDPEESSAAKEERATHVVQRGETLSSISRRYYGTARFARWIAEKNGLENPDAIEVGTKLEIPALPASSTSPPKPDNP